MEPPLLSSTSPSVSENYLQKADSIFVDLAQSKPEIFQIDLFRTKKALGILYNGIGAYEKAEQLFLEAQKIVEPLAVANPSSFELERANIQFSPNLKPLQQKLAT